MHVSATASIETVLHDTFQDLLQRFNILLIRQFKNQQPNKGLVIIDQAHQRDYRKLFAEFKRVGTAYQGVLKNVIDIPYFAGRLDTRMLRLADYCAYATFRYYQFDDRRYFDRVLPRFDRQASRQPPDGLKHMTRKPCSCEACAWRRERAVV